MRALLGAHGIHPRKLRGQNFLVDGNLIDAIVREAAPGPDDCVLEVGTGTAILTDALVAKAGRVVSCDIDGRLQTIAVGLREWPDSVAFLEGDILAGKRALNPAVIERWTSFAEGRVLRVVSNLPYSIATPFVANLLWSGLPVRDAVLLVQREAAERFLAVPRTGGYGPVSVAVRLLSQGALLRSIGPQVFWPPPKVQSALIRITPTDPPRAARLREAGLPELLHKAFLWRRKTLRKRFTVAQLEAAGIDPSARPEEVEPQQWERLLTVPPA